MCRAFLCTDSGDDVCRWDDLTTKVKEQQPRSMGRARLFFSEVR